MDATLFGLSYNSTIGDSNSNSNYNPLADFDNDGDVDILDAAQFGLYYPKE